MARRLIGTAVTDSNGEATITYTGTGAGKLNVVAESGTFQSEPYSIIDAIAKDNGTTDTSLWASSTATIDRTSGQYTEFIGTGSSNSIYFTKNSTSDYFDKDTSYAFEFDCLNANASSIYIYQGSNSKGGIGIPVTDAFCLVRLEYDATNQKISLFKNNVQQGSSVSLSSVTSNFGVRIVDWQGDLDLKLKNFRAYPI